MVSAWEQGIGLHRPGVLESTMGILQHFPIGFDNSPIVVDTWPSANRAFLVRVRNPRPFQPTHAYVDNGNAVTGNVDIGVYEFASGSGVLTRLASTGGVAQTGTSTLQMIALSGAPQLPAGDLVLALVLSSAAARVTKRNFGPALARYERLWGMGQAESAYPLPASLAGFTAPTSGFGDVPLFGVTSRLF